MTYTTRLRDHQIKQIEPIIRKMESLAEGESCAFEGAPSSIDSIRLTLYNYLFINGIKAYYKLVRESPNKLRIVRKADPLVRTVSDEDESKAAHFVTEHLLDCETAEEALLITVKLERDPYMVAKVMREFERIMGK